MSIMKLPHFDRVWKERRLTLLQAKYKCKICTRITEREEHCGERAELVFGRRIITNDTVNILSVLFASLMSIITFFLLN